MIAAKRVVFRLGGIPLTRGLSSRASSILSSLDISTTDEISGVYDGQWRGSGEIIASCCPTTGETLARVKTATPQELHDALGRTREAYTMFRSESGRFVMLLAVPNNSLPLFRCAFTTSRGDTKTNQRSACCQGVIAYQKALCSSNRRLLPPKV